METSIRAGPENPSLKSVIAGKLNPLTIRTCAAVKAR
jgi:hypothetical protein